MLNDINVIKSLLHPKVWEAFHKKHLETGIPSGILIVSLFNKLSIKSLIDMGQIEDEPIPQGVTFYRHDGDHEIYLSNSDKSKVDEVVKRVAEKTSAKGTKPAAAPDHVAEPAAESSDNWMSGFPKRAITALTDAGINSMEDLTSNYGIEDLKSLKGMGEPTIERLIPVLAAQGIKLHAGTMFKSAPVASKSESKPAQEVKSARPAVSERVSESQSNKTRELSQKVEVSVKNLSDDEEIVPDYYGDMARIDLVPGWWDKALDVYCEAWDLPLSEGKSMFMDVLKSTGLSMRISDDWGKLREVACGSLPSSEDQHDIIIRYANENGLKLSDVILAHLGQELPLSSIDISMASGIINSINQASKADGETDWF